MCVYMYMYIDIYVYSVAEWNPVGPGPSAVRGSTSPRGGGAWCVL